jgi:hypothetical protein
MEKKDNVFEGTENGYVGFYKGKRAECTAKTKLEAQEKLAKILKAKRSYDVAVELAEVDGEQVTHIATEGMESDVNDEISESERKQRNKSLLNYVRTNGKASATGGRWVTVNHHHIYIKKGKVVIGPAAIKSMMNDALQRGEKVLADDGTEILEVAMETHEDRAKTILNILQSHEDESDN